MNDKDFDEKSAKNWAQAIESQEISKRDEDFYPKINEWLDKSNSKSILDLGCGQGICSKKLNLGNRDYYGVDPSPYLINRAKELYSGLKKRFVLGNAYSLPFQEKEFDSVFSIAVWHLLEDLDQASSELSRVLNENGSFLIITANSKCQKEWTSAYDHVELDGSKIIGMDADSVIQDTFYLRSEDGLVKSLARFGLEVTTKENIRIWTLISGLKK